MGIEPTPTPQPAPDNGFEDRMVPMPSALYLLGSSWLSGLTREGSMLLCQSRAASHHVRAGEHPRGVVNLAGFTKNLTTEKSDRIRANRIICPYALEFSGQPNSSGQVLLHPS